MFLLLANCKINPHMENPVVCLSRTVNVSWQQHRLQGSNTEINPVSLAWLVQWELQQGKPSVAYACSQWQYCVLSEE